MMFPQRLLDRGQSRKPPFLEHGGSCTVYSYAGNATTGGADGAELTEDQLLVDSDDDEGATAR